MPDRLPRELRVLYELSRVVAVGPYSLEEVMARITAEVRSEFAFADVRLVRVGEDALFDAALAQRRAVVEGGRVAIPVLVEGRCLGYLVGDGCPRTLDELDLHLLSAIGLVAGVFIAKAEQYEELQRALEELRRVDELKGQFVAVASHELRMPIAVVFGIASTIYHRGPELSPHQIADLRLALFEQSRRLRDLTEQLLDLSRIDSGRLTVQVRPFRPWDVIVAVVPPDRLGDVRIEIDPHLELVSDPQAFERVVANLIVNALEYGRPPVVVHGRDGEGLYHLAVEDRGDGVPCEFVPHLFDRFTRAEDSHPARTRGAGLGLAIAHEFADAMGADLDYEPAEPQGARFVLAVPVELSRPREARR
jgi:signal transduction histidine kinase